MRERGAEAEPQAHDRAVRPVETVIGAEEVCLVTRPGFPEWGHVTQAAQLIALRASVKRGERVLVCPCGHGALAVWAARQTEAARVTALDTNSIAVEAARATVAANRCGAVRVAAATPTPQAEPYDVVLMTLPKGRDLARLLFLAAFKPIATLSNSADTN